MFENKMNCIIWLFKLLAYVWKREKQKRKMKYIKMDVEEIAELIILLLESLLIDS